MPSNMDSYVAAYGGNLPAERFNWSEPSGEGQRSVRPDTTAALGATPLHQSEATATNPFLEIVEPGCEGRYEDL